MQNIFAQKGQKTVKRSTQSASAIEKEIGYDHSKVTTETIENDNTKYGLSLKKSATFLNMTSSKLGLKIQTNEENSLPINIEGIPKNIRTTSKSGRTAATSAAYNYLSAVKPLMQLKNPEQELNITTTQQDEFKNTHTKFEQNYKGIKIYGSEIILHSKNNQVNMMNGRYFPTPNLSSIKPNLSINNTIDIAINELKKNSIIRPLSQTEMVFMKYKKPVSELIIFHPNEDINNPKLTYHLTVRPNLIERWEFFIDANTGEILDKYNHTCSVEGLATANGIDLNGISRTINTYQSSDGNYHLIDNTKPLPNNRNIDIEDPQGVIWTINAGGSRVDDISVSQISSTNNTWNNPEAISAHFNAGKAYDYFQNIHGRKSLNNANGTIISIINIKDENGEGFDNAFWNGEFMGYGRGKVDFKPLAGGLDVAGHEMTHGVVEKSANLEYKGQSGAINESMADIFGALIDKKNDANGWKIGEDVVKISSFPSGALRDLSNPNNGGRRLGDSGYQPATMSQYYTGTQDNSGVHINSGIPNFAFYKIATAITKEKAEKIYYRALTTYLTRTSKFIDLRRALIKSATDIYGSNEANVIQTAFDAVGINDGNSTSIPTTTPPTSGPKPSTDVPVNIGAEFLLSYDPVTKILYKSSTAGEADEKSFVALARDLELEHKPSVSDDGTYAYYVDGLGFINRVNLSGTPVVQKVSSTGTWRNVAISKDGKKIAALPKLASTPSATDKIIRIFDLSSNPITQKDFTFYNPTYTNGVQTGQVLYADALEWDHESENIIYDAWNSLKKSTGTNINFWDVGFINVWNNKNNNFGNGKIEKLFTDLEEGESIANPTFAKNSTNIVAFDYTFFLDENLNYIFGVDIESKKDNFEFIFENISIESESLGYEYAFPEFSSKDDKILFNNAGSIDNETTTNTVSINLKPNKISSIEGSEKYLIGNSKFAVWYTVGKRQLPSKTQAVISATKVPNQTPSNTVIDINAKHSGNLPFIMSIISGPASIINSKIVLNGNPGKVKYQLIAEANSQYYGAIKIDSFCVTPNKPSIIITQKSDNGAHLEYTSSVAQNNQWFENNLLKSNNQTLSVVSGRTYYVQTNIEGCLSEKSESIVGPAFVLGIENILEKQISIAPNPTKDFVKVDFPKELGVEKFTLTSSNGKTLAIGKVKGNAITVNLNNYSSGVYFIKFTTKNGSELSKKIIKN
ncbi:MAG: M4 family metallopeptidase [Pseudarcicella sp.]|nr:M4 family metallopeptidase [Pseudarcicella sp.]